MDFPAAIDCACFDVPGKVGAFRAVLGLGAFAGDANNLQSVDGEPPYAGIYLERDG